MPPSIRSLWASSNPLERSGRTSSWERGQPLGLPLSFGGPYVGFLATRERYLRKMPGRICGETRDVERKRGFVLTLKTREQDIRRERATSNICTNQALCATAVTIYLAALGPEGLREVGLLNWRRSHQAADALTRLKGVSRRFSGTTFNEFVVGDGTQGQRRSCCT